MARTKTPEIPFPEGCRYLAPWDAGLEFGCDPKFGTPRSWVDFAKTTGNPVFVKEIDNVLLAVALVIVERDHLWTDELLRNMDYEEESRGSGGELLLTIEKRLAPALGVKDLRLEAKNESLVKYYKRFDYVEWGKAYTDPEWGWLQPMRNSLP